MNQFEMRQLQKMEEDKLIKDKEVQERKRKSKKLNQPCAFGDNKEPLSGTRKKMK